MILMLRQSKLHTFKHAHIITECRQIKRAGACTLSCGHAGGRQQWRLVEASVTRREEVKKKALLTWNVIESSHRQ